MQSMRENLRYITDFISDDQQRTTRHIRIRKQKEKGGKILSKKE